MPETWSSWTSAEGLSPRPAAPDRPPAVVDSWLVRDGRVRALHLHERRFADSCARLGLPVGPLAGFFAAVRAELPATGRWFPRIEAYPRDGGAVLGLRMRSAPPRRATTSLWVPGPHDPRRHPTIKGPDLRILARLRERAREHGADDALLRTPGGAVVETAHSAVVWWRDGTLCVPPAGLSPLPSVTRTLIVQLAAAWGFPVREEIRTPEELVGTEVWTANALHGISPVTTWLFPSGAVAGGHGTRAAHWQRALCARALFATARGREPLPHAGVASGRTA